MTFLNYSSRIANRDVSILQTPRVIFSTFIRELINVLTIKHLSFTIMIKYSIAIKGTKPGTKKADIQPMSQATYG